MSTFPGGVSDTAIWPTVTFRTCSNTLTTRGEMPDPSLKLG